MKLILLSLFSLCLSLRTSKGFSVEIYPSEVEEDSSISSMSSMMNQYLTHFPYYNPQYHYEMGTMSLQMNGMSQMRLGGTPQKKLSIPRFKEVHNNRKEMLKKELEIKMKEIDELTKKAKMIIANKGNI